MLYSLFRLWSAIAHVMDVLGLFGALQQVDPICTLRTLESSCVLLLCLDSALLCAPVN